MVSTIIKKELLMNKFFKNKSRVLIKIPALIGGAMLLGACVSNDIVSLTPTEQLKDLNDLDRDGVIEARERCAGTVLGASIDNYGCGTQSTIIEPFEVDIKFDNNSYEIPRTGLSRIQALAEFLIDNPELKVLIEGHTSNVGSASLNQTVSEQRANAVVSAITSKYGVPTERVSGIGYGFDRLADPRDNDIAHATNRRIMASLSQTVSVDDMIWTIYSVD
jgi:OOP family OmpA-OmpF porin